MLYLQLLEAQHRRANLGIKRIFIVALVLASALVLANTVSGESDLVRQVQKRLIALGYDPGPVNGLMGTKTRAALSAFQKREDLASSGKIDASTKWVLGIVLRQTGSDAEARKPDEVALEVRIVQQRLKAFGHNPGPIDGAMGRKTRAALRAFQQSNALAPTGEIDGETKKALRRPLRGAQLAVAPSGTGAPITLKAPLGEADPTADTSGQNLAQSTTPQAPPTGEPASQQTAPASEPDSTATKSEKMLPPNTASQAPPTAKIETENTPPPGIVAPLPERGATAAQSGSKDGIGKEKYLWLFLGGALVLLYQGLAIVLNKLVNLARRRRMRRAK